MRIISGLAKGFKLKTQDSKDTRPVTDRIKENVFNILEPFSHNTVLDLFAGSGSFGLEAMSRGAESCVFVEKDNAAASMIIQNIAHLEKNIDHMGSVCDVIRSDAIDYVNKAPANCFDLVFCDPPFPLTQDREWVYGLHSAVGRVLNDDGLLIYREPKSNKIKRRKDMDKAKAKGSGGGSDLSEIWPLQLHREKEYGINRVLFFKQS